jgi:hypothetical protein
MVSRENTVIVGFIALTLVLLYGLLAVTTLPTWASSAVVLGVGVVAPLLVNEYLSKRTD